MCTTARAGSDLSQEPGLHLGLPHEYQEPKHFGHCPLPPRMDQEEAGSEQESQDYNQHSCMVPGCLSLHATTPAFRMPNFKPHFQGRETMPQRARSWGWACFIGQGWLILTAADNIVPDSVSNRWNYSRGKIPTSRNFLWVFCLLF